MKIGIIGSCGKNGAMRKVRTENYLNMINSAREDVKRLSFQNPKTVTLVSGGAALSDHIAVELFLNDVVKGLVLHLPCKWDETKCKFIDNGEDNWKTNPGRISNNLHEKFSKRLNKNSLNEIQMAIDKGATVVIAKSFWDRNLKIAKESDALIAFTFEKEMTPGTKHTWDACKIDSQVKVHHLISSMNLRHTIN